MRVSISSWLLLLLPTVFAQYNSQTYPDPHLDPFTCRVTLPGPVCDPSAILLNEERTRIAQRIQQLVGVTAPIRNTSPSCTLRPGANLEITVAVIDKIGSQPHMPIDIEKFANNLKRRYQNFQVFTVAGRDAKISKDTLKRAFERNVGHFKEGRYALGLEGMIEVIVAAYGNAHIIRTPTPESISSSDSVASGSLTDSKSALGAPSENTISSRSVPSEPNHRKPFSSEPPVPIEEKDKIWVEIMRVAISRCGGDTNRLPENIRAVVEEAMMFSLQLISDGRYNAIEEEVDTHKDVLGIRDQAWRSASTEFLMPLYSKHATVINAGVARTCPSIASKALFLRN